MSADPCREVLAALVRNFPTDDDLDRAGWNPHKIEAACKAYDAARAALAHPVAQEPAAVPAALILWRAICDEAECVVLPDGGKRLLLTEEMCQRLGAALEVPR